MTRKPRCGILITKHSIFHMVHSHSIFLAEIFNAFNPDDLIITTLENAIYLGMKNDVSFIIDWQLVLYEHQSTVNPNMPIRDLFYVACVFSTFLIEANFYSRKLIELPEPQFVVFYNGIEEMPIDECVQKGILAEFLRKNRAEVLRMCLFEYDQEKHLQQERDDSKEEGRREEMDRVNRLVELLLSQGRQEDLKRSVTDREYQEKLMKEFGI